MSHSHSSDRIPIAKCSNSIECGLELGLELELETKLARVVQQTKNDTKGGIDINY